MRETVQQRMERQFKNYEWRHGRGVKREDHTQWAVPYREGVILDQSLDQRSQFEWYAEITVASS